MLKLMTKCVTENVVRFTGNVGVPSVISHIFSLYADDVFARGIYLMRQNPAGASQLIYDMAVGDPT